MSGRPSRIETQRPCLHCDNEAVSSEETSGVGEGQRARDRSCPPCARRTTEEADPPSVFSGRRWKTKAEPDDYVPTVRPFIPKRRPGVQPPLDAMDPSAAEIFSHFFDAEVFGLMCKNTNKYAAKELAKGRKSPWTDITPAEFKRYVGLLLYMSVVSLPRITDYWRRNTIFHVALPASIMSCDRFMVISANVHMSDPDEDTPESRKALGGLYLAVKPLLEMIRSRCMAIYHPQQHISVGAQHIKQYMKAKPTRRGRKFFVLADVSGYTIDFRLDTGRSEVWPGNIVATLVNEAYLGSGYVVYTDNYYTSPLLFRHLGQLGFGACGTYRPGRAGVPTTQENALNKKSPRGSIRWIRDGDLLFVQWMDARAVFTCTNAFPVFSGDMVKRREKTDGVYRTVQIPRPAANTHYNRYMGAVDTSAQLPASRSVHRRPMPWPVTVLQHLLDMTVSNSYVIHREICSGRQRRHKTREAFQEELWACLLTPCHDHVPVPTSSAEGAGVGRWRCKLCKRSTPWKCESCDVGLCLQVGRNCFAEYHRIDTAPPE